MSEFWQFVRQIAATEFGSEAGRANFLFGVMVLVLIVMSFVSTIVDYFFAGYIATIRPNGAVPEIPQPPWWAFGTFIVYAVGCVYYLRRRE